MGMAIAVIAPIGDLFASMIKRDLGVKDTGRLFGPHGGLIDRLDAVLFTVVAGLLPLGRLRLLTRKSRTAWVCGRRAGFPARARLFGGRLFTRADARNRRETRMSKLFSKRPSPALIVAMVALIAALGGGAYAATQKKVEYKGLSKEARLKVLPFSKTATGTDCNPTAAATYTDCATVSVDGSTGFPAALLRLVRRELRGGRRRLPRRLPPRGRQQPDHGHHDQGRSMPTKTADHGSGYGIRRDARGRARAASTTLSVACNENTNDLRVRQFQLSAFQVR